MAFEFRVVKPPLDVEEVPISFYWRAGEDEDEDEDHHIDDNEYDEGPDQVDESFGDGSVRYPSIET